MVNNSNQIQTYAWTASKRNPKKTRTEQSTTLFYVFVYHDIKDVFITLDYWEANWPTILTSADGERATWESLAAFQVFASGERSPAHSAVGVAAFQLAKTTFQFVRAGDLLDHFTFIKCCQSQSMLVEPELCAEGLQQREAEAQTAARQQQL